MGFGHINDLRFIKPEQHDIIRRNAEYLGKIFKQNADNCKLVGITVEYQRKELLALYGIRISQTKMSEFKNGKRYKVGFMLVMALRDYWNIRGIPFSLD